MNKIWMRAGMTLSVSDDEAQAILAEDENTAAKAAAKVIKEGRFAFDGESYIPQVCVAEYNRNNGTSFEEYDVEMQLDIPAKEVHASAAQGTILYALIENWADAGNDSVGENVLLFADYTSALAQYKATLAAEREDGIMARWGENAVIDEGDDYICVTNPKVDNYASYHYKLYIDTKTVL